MIQSVFKDIFWITYEYINMDHSFDYTKQNDANWKL